ncbi:YdeI/OmpD-associated family protein [uncultured Friedmanniella sp.]|uniref:YdeI/OmpD-associated family protein n=1 Tax=uncultured Friedmanniella sp. TaxID=335381 RepID=UPI0035C965C3
MRFLSTLELGGKTATGLEVPAEVVDGLAAGKRPKVTVTILGYSYRSSIAVMGGRYLLPVSAEVRTATGVTAGDEVSVQVELDDAPREVAVPDDLAAALAEQPTAAAAFAKLSYSQQRQHVLAVEGAKAADTRARRVAKVVAVLGEG